MNSKECDFSFETNFEGTSSEFRRNVIRTNDLPRFEQSLVYERTKQWKALNVFTFDQTQIESINRMVMSFWLWKSNLMFS
jgi:hypothetical protein